MTACLCNVCIMTSFTWTVYMRRMRRKNRHYEMFLRAHHELMVVYKSNKSWKSRRSMCGKKTTQFLYMRANFVKTSFNCNFCTTHKHRACANEYCLYVDSAWRNISSPYVFFLFYFFYFFFCSFLCFSPQEYSVRSLYATTTNVMHSAVVEWSFTAVHRAWTHEGFLSIVQTESVCPKH